MKKLIAVTLVTGILLIGLVAALFVRVEKSPVDNLDETTLSLSFSGAFMINKNGNELGELSWVAVRSLNYPEENDYLELLDFTVSEPYIIDIDEWGNHVIVLNFSNPSFGRNTYKISMRVKVKKIHNAELPNSIETIHTDFINPNNLIQSNSPIIQQALTNIVRSDMNQFSKIRAVNDWVYQNIQYDLALEPVSKDAVWTLENKRGVCVEKAHLALAFLRSLEIPARHVYGIAPENFPAGWQEHTWVEAYIGKWVSVDPTWDEVDYLDPAHVTFARVPDQSFVEEKISVSGKNIDGVTIEFQHAQTPVVEVLNEVRGEEPIYIKLFGKKIKIK